MSLFQNFISWLIFKFRAIPIGNAILPFLKNEKTALDIGCFDGSVSSCISGKIGIKIKGADISLPQKTFIEAVKYGGKKLPFKNESFDSALLIDVLHHTKCPLETLLEAKRIARKSIILKDMTYLSFFNYFANYIVDFPGILLGFGAPKYLSEKEWLALIKKAGLKIAKFDTTFKLCSADPEMHIIMRLEKH